MWAGKPLYSYPTIEKRRKNWFQQHTSLRIIHRILSAGQFYRIPELLMSMLCYKHNEEDQIRIRVILATHFLNIDEWPMALKFLEKMTLKHPIERRFRARVLLSLGHRTEARNLLDAKAVASRVLTPPNSGKQSDWIAETIRPAGRVLVRIDGIKRCQDKHSDYLQFRCRACGYQFTVGKIGRHLQKVKSDMLKILSKESRGFFCYSCFEEYR